MLALIRLFWKICTLQRGPQDVPYSVFLFASLVLLDLLIGMLIFKIPDAGGADHPFGKILAFLLADKASFIGAVYVIMSVHNRTKRGLQTLTAATGIDVILNLLHLPFVLLASGAKGHPGVSTLFVFGTMAIFIWQIVAYSHIFRNALGISMFKAGGYALFLFVLYMVVISLMFPVPH